MGKFHDASDYVVDISKFLDSCKFDVRSERVEQFLESCESYSISDEYEMYGVDNDFDLAEAIYDEFSRSTGNLIRQDWFVDFRIQCAMNPEYTEKCLQSRAFRDVRDDILKKLGDR